MFLSLLYIIHHVSVKTLPRTYIFLRPPSIIIFVMPPPLLQDAFISYNTRAYYYNGQASIPGPTLRVKPGDTLTINLINNLKDTGADSPTLANNNSFHSKYDDVGD